MRERVTLHTAAATVTALVWAPLVVPGYVLSYDMVFVPRQPLRWDLIAPAGSLPRAVPQDAVVSVLNLVAPGWLLQRVALVAAVYFAVLGAARLVPAGRLLTRIVAGVGYAWTPFFAERLLLGQWGLLLAYCALPWLVRAAMGARAQRPGATPRLVVAAAVCAITPTGGVIALAVAVALTAGIGWPRLRTAGIAVGAVAVTNTPWLVAAAVTAAGGRSDPAGVAAFAVRGENWSGPFGAVVGTGGIWNAQTTPDSRASALVPVVTAVLLALAAVGYPWLRRRWPDSGADRLAAVALAGLCVALAGALPLTGDLMRWLVTAVPGAGLLRDGQKFLIPYALILTLAVALGAERIADRLAGGRARAVLAAMVLLPVALMPDLALGAAGQLWPVSFPRDWAAVAGQVATARGQTVSLPFHLYRRYDWNRGRPVIDPAPRYLPTDVLVDDTLLVGTVAVAGESPRAARIRQMIAAREPVAGAGARWILLQHNSGGAVPAEILAGLIPVYQGPVLTLYENPAATGDPPPSDAGDRWLIVAGHLLAVALVGAAMWHLPRTRTAW